MKHYRPFRYTAAAIVILAVFATVGSASAQPAPKIVTQEMVDDYQKGMQALKREDYVSALEWFRKGADLGEPSSQTMVGTIYLRGWGVTKDYAEAMGWYQKAASVGHAEAQIKIGTMYKKGWGVSQDDAQAVVWMRKAAEQGNATAQNFVGLMYAVGSGVPKDYDKALIWIRKAADQGDPEGETSLGTMYRDGAGVPKDYAQAASWYRKAAVQGWDDAKTQLNSLQKQRQAENTEKKNKIPAALQFRCWLETSPPDKDANIQGQRYDACLRSNWKRLQGSEPFPGD